MTAAGIDPERFDPQVVTLWLTPEQLGAVREHIGAVVAEAEQSGAPVRNQLREASAALNYYATLHEHHRRRSESPQPELHAWEWRELYEREGRS